MSVTPHRYRELAPLAEGGMASLCLAERDDGYLVVIKRVRAPFACDAAYQRLFDDEGRVSALLRSEYLVELLERGEDERGAYLVFAYVEGSDLGWVWEAVQQSGDPIDLPAWVALALGILRGLRDAHEACDAAGEGLGLVHRDISPGNILLSQQGEVRLADFGVAASRIKTEHTVAGELKGKFAYMAPEQTRGWALDARADLFSAGVVLWELATAARLFDGPTDVDVAQAVRDQPTPSARERNPEVSPALDAWLQALTEKDAAARPASARAALAMLDDVREELGLEGSLKVHVARLARAHPRPRADSVGPGDERRRTQRVLGAPLPAPPRQPRGRGRGFAWGSAAVALALGISLRWWQREVTAPPAASPPLVSTPTPTPTPAPTPAPAPTPTPTPAPAPAPAPAPTPTPTPTPTPSPTPTPTPTPSPSPSTRRPPRKPPPAPAPPALSPRALSPRALVSPGTSGRRGPAATPPSGAAPDPALAFGTLLLESEPWAHVSVDGAALGSHTPLLGLRLPAGRHEIRLENPVLGLTKTLAVDIRGGMETRRFVDLTRP